MGTARPGSHVRDRSAPAPVHPELTRLSVRWTRRASRWVFGVWVAAGLVGAWLDARSRYGHLTWCLVWGGRGGAGFVWEVHVPKGLLALFAFAVTGVALICSLVGAARMSAAARAGRPHRGPSRWSIVGVALAAGLGANVVGCFVLSEIYSPASDAVLLAGFAPQVLGLMGGLVLAGDVRSRYNPWTWAARRARPAPSAREIGASAVRRRRWAEEFLRGERPPSGATHPRAPRASRAHASRVEVTPAGVLWRSFLGRSGSIPAARISEVRTTEVVVAGHGTTVLAYALVLDHEGAALLRVSAASGRAVSAVDGKRRLSQMWDPLGVPVRRYSSGLSRTKDLRRRWPEAFPWVRAYPVLTAWVVVAAWMLVVVPVLDQLVGP